ncbi:MAG: DUF3179 domain-containing protein, partial [Anaerolineae bacterium]|nr:DUF3179 domain-containing protein [Anaerolineae bacterium]
MKITRVLGISLAVWLMVSLVPVQAQDNSVDLSKYYEVMLRMGGEVVTLWRGGSPDTAIFETVGSSGDPLYIAPLIDVAFFLRGTDSPLESAAFAALGTLTGQTFGTDWRAWFTWDSAQNPTLPPSYATFKGMLLSLLVDPDFTRFLNSRTEETARVNVSEVVWGGVRVDGITPLTNARQITQADAAAEGESQPDMCRDGDCRYPAPDEYVFGITLNGDSRAYPLRLLNWHEVMNDTFGLAPLYDQPGGNVVCQFRAPTEFHAVARQGDTWVMVSGESAGCPPEGWLTTPETLKWSDERDWTTVSGELPDLVADPGATPLAPDEGVTGSIAGQAVTLAYCTLCGSGILYDSTIPDVVLDGDHLGPMTLEFSSTGLLMRSNKLMYDRDTDTVWNAMTGEPAFGALAPADLRLTMLPMVVTDWESWLAEHPDTSVLSLKTGYQIPY